MISSHEKTTLRRECLQRRAALHEPATRNGAICARVVRLPIYQQARVIHCYLSVHSEVNTHLLLAYSLAAGKRVVVPMVQRNTAELTHSWLTSVAEQDMEPGVLGIPQPRTVRPVRAGVWDLTIVPLLAFDRRGYRLGYGKGYYDRLLTEVSTPTIGLAFAVQEVERIPYEPHDVRMDWIVTDQEVIQISDSERVALLTM